MKIKYPKLLKEILFSSDTVFDLNDFAGISGDDLIKMLTGEKTITVRDAQRIQRILRSTKPLEELFEEAE